MTNAWLQHHVWLKVQLVVQSALDVPQEMFKLAKVTFCGSIKATSKFLDCISNVRTTVSRQVNTAVLDIPEGYVLVGLKFIQVSLFGDRFLVSLTSTSLDSS